MDEIFGDEESVRQVRKRGRGIDRTMLDPCVGGGSSASHHPLGWSGNGPCKSHIKETDSDAHAEGCWESAGPAEPEDAYDEFLAAAAAVPEALPTPVRIHRDLRIVLNLPASNPWSEDVIIVDISRHEAPRKKRSGVTSQQAEEVPHHADVMEQSKSLHEEYDGAPGIVLSDSADSEGRWKIETTRRGESHVLLCSGFCLLWQGAPVIVADSTGNAQGDASGLIAAERPERKSGHWRVDVHKTMALLPANLRELRLPGFDDLQEAELSTPVLSRGMSVELVNLRAGAAYNGLSGLIISCGPNQRGRWEVAVKIPLSVPRERLRLVGSQIRTRPRKHCQQSSAAQPVQSSVALFQPGDVVEIFGLVKAPQHNGLHGTIMGRAPQAAEAAQTTSISSSSSASGCRWRVQCKQQDAKHTILLLDLKQSNLRPVVSAATERETKQEVTNVTARSTTKVAPVFRLTHQRSTHTSASADSSTRVGRRKPVCSDSVSSTQLSRKRKQDEADDAHDPMALLERGLLESNRGGG